MEDQNRADSVGDERPGTVIGRYTLVRKIGEGGFGAVFLAEQSEPVRRQVALKVIKLGMDTRDVIARFEQERQALALMDHPHIAKVLDAGSTASGRPYFVMELVEGVPITEYCDEHRLTVPERLEIMFDVCQAVQHAHGKGLIHRDLKPGNVLVSTKDGRPHPKVIDFGVAKATSSKLTEMTLLTEQFQMIGTPLYMSPEQAAGSLDIDTRTDVYSLGVLLYEVLTGATPVDEETLRTALYHEMQRLIREVEPPKPSTRVANATASLAGVAERRRIEPTRLSSVLRGELDWIVMRALEKDRARRYDTASALATDIRRYLSGDAVVAAPPSRSYRVAKFVKRNKGAVASGATVFVALVVGLAGTLWQARAAETQRDLAVAAKAEAEKIADFQSSALRRVNPSVMGSDLVADLRSRIDAARSRRGEKDAEREAALTSFDALLADVNATDAARRILDANILAPASQAVGEQFGSEPMIEAKLREALAKTYSSLGLSERALSEAERRVAALTALLGPVHGDTLRARTALGTVLFALGRLPESEATLAATASEYAARFPADDPGSLRNRECVGVLDMSLRRFDEAKRIFEDVTAAEERLSGPDGVELANAIQNLATACLNLNDADGAIPLFERAVRIFAAANGEADPRTLRAEQSLAKAYQLAGRSEDAIAKQFSTISTLERVKGERHPDTAAAISRCVEILTAQARFDEAEAQALKALEIRRAVLGEAHPDTIASIEALAILYGTLNRRDEAERLFVESLRLDETVYGPDSPNTMMAVSNLGVFYWFGGRLDEATPLFERCVAYQDARGDAGLVDASEARTNLAILYTSLRRLDEAQALVDRSIADLAAKLGPEHPKTLHAIASRVTLHVERREFALAETDFAELLAAQRKVLAPDDPALIETVCNLANACRELDRDADAEPLLREALDARRRTLGATHPQTLDTLRVLANLLADADRAAESRRLYVELIAGRRETASGVNATPRQIGDYARLLLTCPFDDLRDTAEALRVAEKSAEAAGGSDPAVLDGLASAQAAAGRSTDAAATQRRALDLLPDDAPERPEYEARLLAYEAETRK